jgi:hypothetical protein
MEKFYALTNKFVKGRELKALGLKFVKATNSSLFYNGFQYKIGENKKKTHSDRKLSGFTFYPLQLLGEFFVYNSCYHEVTFEDDEIIFINDNGICRAHKIVLYNTVHFSSMPNDVRQMVLKEYPYAIQFMN